jgi:hypothetical protein
MAVIGNVVEGDTDDKVFTLYENGVAFDGTNFTLADMIITSIDGQSVNTASKFAWLVAGSGTVSYSPAAGDFYASKSPYRVRVKLQDGNGKVRHYPNDGTAEIKVLSPRA